MEALIRTRHVPLSPALRLHCVERLEGALRPFRRRVVWVALTLEDAAGSRRDVEQRCRIVVGLDTGGRVVVEAQAMDPRSAVNHAAHAVNGAVADGLVHTPCASGEGP